MRITITIDSTEKTPVSIDDGSSEGPGDSGAVDTGPAGAVATGLTATPTAGAVSVASPATEGPPPFYPESSAPPSPPVAAPGDLSAGAAPNVADVATGAVSAGGPR